MYSSDISSHELLTSNINNISIDVATPFLNVSATRPQPLRSVTNTYSTDGDDTKPNTKQNNVLNSEVPSLKNTEWQITKGTDTICNTGKTHINNALPPSTAVTGITPKRNNILLKTSAKLGQSRQTLSIGCTSE